MAGLLYDGIPSTRIDSTTFSGTELFVTSTNVTTVSGVNVSVAGSVTDGQGRLRSVGAGSPTTYGLTIQTGSAIASDVSVNVAFGTAFGAIPRVVISPAQSGANVTDSYVGSTTAAGFIFFGQSGIAHNYVAIGGGA